MITFRLDASLLENDLEESIYRIMEDDFNFELYEPFEHDVNDTTKVVAQFEGEWDDFKANQSLQDILSQTVPSLQISNKDQQ